MALADIAAYGQRLPSMQMAAARLERGPSLSIVRMQLGQSQLFIVTQSGRRVGGPGQGLVVVQYKSVGRTVANSKLTVIMSCTGKVRRVGMLQG